MTGYPLPEAEMLAREREQELRSERLRLNRLIDSLGDGCRWYDRCLSCPFRSCIYDGPEHGRGVRSRQARSAAVAMA